KWTQTQLDVYDLMKGKDWGPRWQELIDAVVKFEESQKWECGSFDRNRTKLRPQEIGQWMKEHRRSGDYEKLLPGFGERLLEWWRAIGPDYRRAPPELEADEVWEPPRYVQGSPDWNWVDWIWSRVAGGNGMLLVVLALTWW
ncbi:hypothetical protein C8R46DRAFT_809421, partial [Mycena filopes]